MIKESNIERAAHSHTDLNIFSGIRGLLESGVVYTKSGRSTADRIIKLCGEECHRQIKVYDKILREER